MIYSNQFLNYIQLKGIVPDEKNQNQQLNEHQFCDEPKFKYNYTSLLVVGSKNKDRFIKELVLYMKTKKMLF
jgi:hypothetical protein